MTAAETSDHDRPCCTASDIVQIKRYPNRRFYDRRSRKYVTLQEIEDLVLKGQTIDVRDSRNDEDLTRVVLTQILLERHPERMETFPIALLHLILRANDLALEFLGVFLRLSLTPLEGLQESRTLVPFSSPFDWMRMFFPGFVPGPRQLEKAPEATVAQLSHRVAELEGRIKQLESESLSAPDRGEIPELPKRNARGPHGRPSN